MCDSATHLGHFISSTDKKSIVKSAKSWFWRSFNIFMSDFGQLSYTVKCKLLINIAVLSMDRRCDKNNIVIFYFTQYIVCIPPLSKVTYCVLKSGKLIFHIYSRYYFSFEQCNCTLSPTTSVFVESTIYNCNFCLHKNPVAWASNINIKTSTSWDTNNIPPNRNVINNFVRVNFLIKL